MSEYEYITVTMDNEAYIVKSKCLSGSGNPLNKHEEMINHLYNENKRLSEALQFYADKDNYDFQMDNNGDYEYHADVMNDAGHIARKATKDTN